MHCDFAFCVGGTHDNVADLTELERLPGAAGIKVFMGSSTGTLLVADDKGMLAILKAIRRRAAFHSEDEARLNERKALRVPGDPRRIPSGATRPPRSSTERLVRLAREARAHACAACFDARGDRVSGGSQGRRELRGDAAHLTLGAEDYERLGTRRR